MNEASGVETAGVSRPLPLRRNKGFRMLWAGQLLSDTGTEIGLLAYPHPAGFAQTESPATAPR